MMTARWVSSWGRVGLLMAVTSLPLGGLAAGPGQSLNLQLESSGVAAPASGRSDGVSYPSFRREVPAGEQAMEQSRASLPGWVKLKDERTGAARSELGHCQGATCYDAQGRAHVAPPRQYLDPQKGAGR